MNEFNIGEKVANFILPTSSNDYFEFESFRKKNNGWHLIIFFKGSWSSSCIEDLINLEIKKRYFEDNGIFLTSISNDSIVNLDKIVKTHCLTFPVLSDQDLKVIKIFNVYHRQTETYSQHGVQCEPAYFLTDEQGCLLFQQKHTSTFGRPMTSELLEIIQHIKRGTKG